MTSNTARKACVLQGCLNTIIANIKLEYCRKFDLRSTSIRFRTVYLCNKFVDLLLSKS
jgi:hypothetical protein